MQGLEAWITKYHPQLLFPLIAIVRAALNILVVDETSQIDYRGFRVVATSLLPIDKSTLIYGIQLRRISASDDFSCLGSSDAGAHAYATDETFNGIMATCGVKTNLKRHRVADGVYMHGPGTAVMQQRSLTPFYQVTLKGIKGMTVNITS